MFGGWCQRTSNHGNCLKWSRKCSVPVETGKPVGMNIPEKSDALRCPHSVTRPYLFPCPSKRGEKGENPMQSEGECRQLSLIKNCFCEGKPRWYIGPKLRFGIRTLAGCDQTLGGFSCQSLRLSKSLFPHSYCEDKFRASLNFLMLGTLVESS